MKYSVPLLIKQHFFTVGIFISIFLAEIAPWIGVREGPLKPEITVKYGATSVIFFISGLILTWQDLKKSTCSYSVHTFIQVFTFLFIPIIVQIFRFFIFLPLDLNVWIVKGLITVSCMPPPVSSAVLITRTIGGNEATAVFNSVLGSFVGIFITPALLFFHLGLSSTLPMWATILQLATTVIIPLIAGQILRLFIRNNFLLNLPLTHCGQLALLLVIYCSFCDMFINKDFTIAAHHILQTIFLVVCLQLLLMYMSFVMCEYVRRRKKEFTPENIVAITFCSTHKSLTLGMPLLTTLYSGYSHMAQISLPLLIYHPVQIMLGFLIVPLGKDWLRKETKTYRLHSKP